MQKPLFRDWHFSKPKLTLSSLWLPILRERANPYAYRSINLIWINAPECIR